jgi:predicted phosphoribosyltransferase
VDTPDIFANRTEAAQMLASSLKEYKGRNPLVLAIPRGAVPMEHVIAESLDGEMNIVLVHRLGAPFSTEFTTGAIDETGWTYIASFAQQFGASGSFLEEEKCRLLKVLKRRRAQYTPFRRPIDPGGRITIVVDDGLATGATMIAALHAIRARKPATLVCAVSVAAQDSLEQVAPLVDDTVCLCTPAHFLAVGQFFRNFSEVGDDEVIQILSQHHKADKPGPSSAH